MKVLVYQTQIVRTPQTQGNFHTYQEHCQRSKKCQISRLRSIGLSNHRTETPIQERRKGECLLSPDRTLLTQTTYRTPRHSIWASTRNNLLLLTSTNHMCNTTFIKTDNCQLTSITINGPVLRTS